LWGSGKGVKKKKKLKICIEERLTLGGEVNEKGHPSFPLAQKEGRGELNAEALGIRGKNHENERKFTIIVNRMVRGRRFKKTPMKRSSQGFVPGSRECFENRQVEK